MSEDQVNELQAGSATEGGKSERSWDRGALIGTVLAVLAVVAGQWLEGGTVGQLFQPVALWIVLGGTVGAVLLSFPREELRLAMRQLPLVYRRENEGLRKPITEILRVANLVRREGLLALETQKSSITNPMLRRGVQFVLDGFDPEAVREALEVEVDSARESEETGARVFEAAGAYAPTIGILGAVLGLIQVLSKLEDPSKIGLGIAVAFVATVYGVAFANLVFLPWSSRLRRLAEERFRFRELTLHGVLGIQEGMNPQFLAEKLEWIAGVRDGARKSSASSPSKSAAHSASVAT